MPRLIVLNGPPACGKSTIARRYADDRPMTLDLEIDLVRRMLGDWKADPTAAGSQARELALAIARQHLLAGRDVVIPQYLGRPDFLRRLDLLAAETGAELHEFVLLDTKDVLVARFHARTRAGRLPEHLDAQELLDRFGGTRQLEAMYDRLLLVVAARENAQVVPAREGDVDGTYAEIVRLIEPAAPVE